MKKERDKHFGFCLIRNFSLIETTLLKFTKSILLNLFYDEKRLLQVKIRIFGTKSFSFDKMFPILLQKDVVSQI